jgi:hypothetical protein
MNTKKILKWLIVGLVAFVATACEKDDNKPKIADSFDTYDLKEYKAERSPKINRLGYAMDMVHDSTSQDTLYLKGSDTFQYDLLFYNQMVYYTNTSGDVVSEGCPVIYLYIDSLDISKSVSACQVGSGTAFFDSYTAVLTSDIAKLANDPILNMADYTVNDKVQKDLLMAAYETLAIGNKFRATILLIPNGQTEEEVQPVFLVKTREGLYAKFMVTAFQGTGVDKQKTAVKWQVFQQ